MLPLHAEGSAARRHVSTVSRSPELATTTMRRITRRPPARWISAEREKFERTSSTPPDRRYRHRDRRSSGPHSTRRTATPPLVETTYNAALRLSADRPGQPPQGRYSAGTAAEERPTASASVSRTSRLWEPLPAKAARHGLRRRCLRSGHPYVTWSYDKWFGRTD